jgi:bifunctional non-homologous end joining protein LigD
LNTPVTFDQTKMVSHQLADAVAADHPDAVVTKMLKLLRKNKVLIDWSQNDSHKTTICAYSLRATERPQVSTPITWPELKRLATRGEVEAYRFSPDDVRARIKKHGDLFAPVLTLKQKLPKS